VNRDADIVTPYTWTIADILSATGGRLISGPATSTYSAIGIDSRTIAEDHLFVAVAGETHDGHGFVTDVLDRGVRGILVAEARTASIPMDRMAVESVTCVAVADTIQALGALARFNRNRGRLKVLAITGSNGKTSTRRFMQQVISQAFVTLSTSGNLNNHIGLPLTLFRLAPQHEAAVLELGMNHPGEITHLGQICQPDVGIITNVGPAHLEGLGTIDNVALAKGELLATIRNGGTAVLNADDARVAAMARGFDGEVVYFGCAEHATVRAEEIHLTDAGTTFRLITPEGRIPVTISSPARVMVANALAAAAAGTVLDVPLDRIKVGLESFTPQSGRMGIRMLGKDIRLVDDSYNANPASMAAAIDTLGRMRGHRRAIAVLGDMFELGEQSAELHRKIGGVVGDAGIDRLYVAGRFAAEVAEGALEKQMPAERIITGSKAAIIERLENQLEPGDLILVKGSRGMAMEDVVGAICRWADDR